ncbi:zonular occludens toxin domain-containing protein [Intestinimonas massiliensis (ex Afouda et al. 2020)]|uniref:AAA family ATPase n=1 Tax=Intestinimonas massiliensis (ex Afouda et al. 2020) TaxID=1673721 RepID=A0ABS9M588_9FIRM|nr:zonular occludens toxin domain-containing protein [Intestinimonas massiliensis (ex Afouda et al. 2020)]MCG4525539.1 AAA family ATPase [Intestinimonas massiliensis (ex Afouda et al. 2020)]
MVGYVLIAFLIGFPLLWDFTTRKYLNPYKLYLVFGKKGSGKSTYLVKLARKHLKKGWIVYTNMEELFMPGVRHFEIKHLGDFVPEAHSLLLLDEVGMIWDNRDYKTFKPQVRDFFKLQRHYHVKVYMASQTFDVDKKLRDLCDGMYLHSNFARVFTLGKRITRKVVITESTSEAESRISEDLKICPFWEWTLTYIPRWAKFFDSHAIPDKPHLRYSTDSLTPALDGDTDDE